MRQGKTNAINAAVGVVVWLVAQSLSPGVAQAQGSTPLAAGAPAGSGTQADPAIQGATGGEQLQEVVVTAERRTSDVQHTGDSISVRKGEDLRENGRTTTEQILEDVVGVAPLTSSAAGTTASVGTDNQGSLYVIRGVASNGTPAGQIIPNVPTTAVYVDGVYEGIGGNYDIDQVEVLRGPQGTLWGRSATSGVISTDTMNPKLADFGGDGLVEFGDYSLQHYSGAVNVPIDQTLALRVSADDYKHDGYYATDGMGAISSANARVKLLYQPNDDFSVLFGYALQDNHVGSGGPQGELSYGNYDTVNYPVTLPNYTNVVDSRQYWANLNWNLGPATLTYIPAYRTWYQNAALPQVAFGPLDIVQTESTPLDQFMTHELRLASNPGSKLSWLVGAFFYDNQLEDHTRVAFLQTLPPPAGQLSFDTQASKQTKDLGVFTEETYAITPSTRLTGGLRYDYTYVQTNELYTVNATANLDALSYVGVLPLPLLPEIDSSEFIGGPAGTRRFYDLTYKGRIEQDLTPTNMLYGMISTGFVPGDIQIRTGSAPCTNPQCLALEAVGVPAPLLALSVPQAAPYSEETLTSYEIGSKNRFLDNTLQINGDIWYYRYGAYQLAVIPNTLNPATEALVTVPMRMYGTELEILWQFTNDDRLGLTYGYTDAYFTNRNAIQPISPPNPFTYFYAQSHLAGVAPQMATITYEHIIHLPGGSTLTPHADARLLSAHDTEGVSQSLYDANGESYVRIGSEVIGDLTLTWASANGAYSLSPYVRNVGDNRYKLTVSPLSVTAGPAFSVPATQYDPRTFGVVASVHF